MELIRIVTVILSIVIGHGSGEQGQGRGKANSHIVGGAVAGRHQYPWQASIEDCSLFECSHICGGVLIGDKWVLTAAHCISDGSVFIIRLGTHEVEPASTGFTVDKIIKNEHFIDSSTEGYPNDIALIKLTSAAPVDGHRIRLASLPTNDNSSYTDNKECWISGWGVTEDALISDYLRHARVDVLSNTDCQERWGQPKIGQGHVCVFDKVNRRVSACAADSGGPLQCKMTDGSWTVIGVTSWVRSGCDSYFPSVYTRISKYLDWIASHVAL